MRLPPILILSIFLWSPLVYAQSFDCAPVTPSKPENLTTEVVGQIDAALGGIVRKLANLNADVKGVYREAKTDTLKDYPDAANTYIWERLIFIKCDFISKSSFSDDIKDQKINELILLYLQGHPVAARFDKDKARGSAFFFFVQFDGWDNTDQCVKLGQFKAAFGEWTSPIFLDTDGRPGDCKVRFAMLDESKLLDDLSVEVAVYADDVGGGQCSGGGPHQIPIMDNSKKIKWTQWLVIDTDGAPGGCQFAFYLDGRTDVVFDVSGYPLHSPSCD